MSSYSPQYQVEKLWDAVEGGDPGFTTTPARLHGHPLRKLRRDMSIRIRMVVLFVFGVIFMLAHDQLNLAMGARTIDEDSSFVSLFGADGLQFVVHSVGTIFAYTTKLLLSAVIGMVFVQVFWMRMRRETHTIAEIDAAFSSKNSPFGIASLKAWRSMFLLAFIPALGAVNMQIVVFSTGSISVQPGNMTSPSCYLWTVNISQGDLGVVVNNGGNIAYTNPKAQVKGFVAQAIMFDSPLAPEILNSSILSYQVQFHAPDLNCTDITSTTNSFELLPPSTVNDPIPVWNTVYQLGTAGGTLGFTTASRDLALAGDGITIVSEDDEQTVECVFYNATYNVSVSQTDVGAFQSTLLNTPTLNNPLVMASANDTGYDMVNSIALADTFARTLNGTVVYDPTTFDFTPDSPVIAYTQFAEQSPGIPWSYKDEDMTSAIPGLLRTVVVGLLSNALPTDSEGSGLLSPARGVCTTEAVVFKYDKSDRARLFLSYLAGLFGTAISIVIGFYAIHVNGVEENIHFSRILASLVHPGLCRHGDIFLDPGARLQLDAQKGEKGKFEVQVVTPV
ncbi:hypothetical protein SCHPADRAFT_549813 [Schizopora paradoxa]|uniref:Uncharacterized protein n=1 Tax=Schizopora paradoxa TaxID=27342 RepID=A0A0H2RJZ1_9AGAM|nr:hypothetical protein SCHPADRAFT_549813 [Schizopora paradoxa]